MADFQFFSQPDGSDGAWIFVTHCKAESLKTADELPVQIMEGSLLKQSLRRIVGDSPDQEGTGKAVTKTASQSVVKVFRTGKLQVTACLPLLQARNVVVSTILRLVAVR